MGKGFVLINHCNQSCIRMRVIFHAIIFLILLCGSTKVMGESMYPIPNRDSVNKLILFFSKTKADTVRIEICLGVAEYFLRNNPDSCSLFIHRAPELSEQLDYKNGLDKSYCLLGLLMQYASDGLDKDNCYLLTIKYNGRGFTKGFDPLQSNTLGLNLRMGLCKHLPAYFAMEYANGVAPYKRFNIPEGLSEANAYSYFTNDEKLKA